MDQLSALSLVWICVALAVVAVLTRVAAPYGRHARRGWGPTLPHRLGWIVMESVSPIVLVVSFSWSGGSIGSASGMLVVLWLLHYANRAVVYPIRARWSGRRMPMVIALSAVIFNAVNGWLNGWGLSGATPSGISLVAGTGLFLVGAAINIRSDETLLRLRRPDDDGYAVPHGGLFEYVSCPNYLGEIIQWFGFALAAWTLPALSFAIWTAANLAPRAVAHHRWYLETFPRYPAHRRALLPGIL